MGFSYSSKLGDGTGIGDDGFSYNPVTDTLDVGTLTANNVVVTALATPTVTSVTPTLTQVGTINVVAGSSLVDGDYFTVDYGSGTIPIEFEATPPNGTTGGRIPFTFAAGDAAGTIRDGLIALINLAAPTKVVASIGGAAAITVSMVTPGEAGGVITENVANAGFTVAGFANPTAATTYGYKVVSYLADGVNGTAASAEVTTAAGHATLSASNFVTVVFAPSPGSTSTRLYRTTGGTAPPRLLYTGTATSYVDTGAAGTAQTPATGNTTGTLTGKFLDGTAAAPSVAFASQETLGMYRAGTNTIGFGATGSASPVVVLNGTNSLGFIGVNSNGGFYFTSSASAAGTSDLILTRAAAATLQLGAATSTSAPVAQTITVQGRTGTDVAGADWTHIGSLGAGNAASGKQIFQVGTPQAAGSTRHVAATALTLQDTGTGGTAAPQALFADGTAAKPSIAFAGETGTGLYKSLANVLTYTTANIPRISFAAATIGMNSSGQITWGNSSDVTATVFDTYLTRAAAATLQLGAADANADGVDQTLTTQGGITGTDRAAGDLTIQTGVGTGAGISNVQIRTPVSLATGTTAQVQSTKVFHSSAQKVLTLGSATTFAAVTFPAASTCTIAIDYSINIVDSNGERKSNGGRYYFSAYRKATGNGVAGTVVETGDAGVASVGGAMTDAMTVTGTATGVTIAQNAAAGTGMAANPTGTINWSITAHGNGAIAVTPQ